MQKTQAKTAPKFTYNGKTLPLTEWAANLGITANALKARLRRWPLDEAMTRERWSRFQKMM